MNPPDAISSSPPTLAAAESGTALSLIEVQLPVSKLCKETYAERRANQGQTITGLGKWWGRKPLLLCRAIILGLLIPGTKNPQRDREIFLKLMTMDAEGLLRRKHKSFPLKDLYTRLPKTLRNQVFDETSPDKPKWKRGIASETKEKMQRLAFEALSYDEKLGYCRRPEEIDGPSHEAWQEINAHLGTNGKNIPELVAELGRRRFGQIPHVGDAFCGGGSVPFEAARLGCSAYGSDLNPVAAILTWAALKIVGGGPNLAEAVRKAQRVVFDSVDRQVAEWGIEHNEKGWRADAFLYCTEAVCPECGWTVPLASTWAVGETSKVIAILEPVEEEKRFNIEVKGHASTDEISLAKSARTVEDATLFCPNQSCGKTTPLRAVRGERGDTSSIRPWDASDVVSRPEDVFRERLYCIRWVETTADENGNIINKRHYCGVEESDLVREAKALQLLLSHFSHWQAKGYIPSRRIEPGEKTLEPIRTRGWTHWHHLFTPRQLLLNGSFLKALDEIKEDATVKVALLLGVGRCADWNSRLCRWGTGAARESIAQTFSNQALNTLYCYASKALSLLKGSWFPISPFLNIAGPSVIVTNDAREVASSCDLWITDPPYADSINYHELSEFFLAWYYKNIKNLFPDWSTDSRRALAVRGSDDGFRHSMVACYRALANSMVLPFLSARPVE